MISVTFTDGTSREIDADSFTCPEGVTEFRKRVDGKWEVVETIKTRTIKGIEIEKGIHEHASRKR